MKENNSYISIRKFPASAGMDYIAGVEELKANYRN